MNVCFSALFGNYEEVKEVKVISEGWQYILYTDQEIESKTWEIIKIEVPEDFTPQLFARSVKILGFVLWEKSIWIDHSFVIDTDLNIWWETYFKGGLTAPAHPLRNDVYAECLDCIIAQRGNKEQVQKQMAKYRELGIPQNGGLIQSGLLMRENTDEVIKLCQRWWQELLDHSIRDQIAFCKVSLGCNFVHMYNWDYRARKDFLYYHHYQRRGGNHIKMDSHFAR